MKNTTKEEERQEDKNVVHCGIRLQPVVEAQSVHFTTHDVLIYTHLPSDSEERRAMSVSEPKVLN